MLAEADIALEYAVFETDRLHEIIYQRGRVAEKALEMACAYAKFVPKVRDVGKYDAVLVNREATLIGPAVIERWVARRSSSSPSRALVTATSGTLRRPRGRR